jgi:hypothetical protein
MGGVTKETIPGQHPSQREASKARSSLPEKFPSRTTTKMLVVHNQIPSTVSCSIVDALVKIHKLIQNQSKKTLVAFACPAVAP